ncbi:MAG TPA: hypothetical protein VGB66_16025, partial [Longimicrobium sp.]
TALWMKLRIYSRQLGDEADETCSTVAQDECSNGVKHRQNTAFVVPIRRDPGESQGTQMSA